jgi:Protein of unknown function (DUF4238)
MNAPARHHVVPRFYLDRWGGSHRRVRARRRDGASFVASTSRVAVERGFYNVADVNGQTSTVVEKYLGSIEGPGAHALRGVDSTGEPPQRGTAERRALASLFALQYTRSPEQRSRITFYENVIAFLADRDLTSELVAEYLADYHLGFVPEANEVEAAADWISASMRMAGNTFINDSIEMMLTSAAEMAPIIEQMNWTLEQDRKGRFISSDTPLTLWRQPTPRDTFEGIGVETCTEIRVPLDPWKLLVLHRESRPTSIQATTDRARRCNAEMARGCHKLIFGSEQQDHILSTVSLKLKRPVLRFAKGPGFQDLADGSTEPLGEILHQWVPRD